LIALRNFHAGPDKEAFHRYLADFDAVDREAELFDALYDCADVLPIRYAELRPASRSWPWRFCRWPFRLTVAYQRQVSCRAWETPFAGGGTTLLSNCAALKLPLLLDYLREIDTGHEMSRCCSILSSII
jgi:hypothetical protein